MSVIGKLELNKRKDNIMVKKDNIFYVENGTLMNRNTRVGINNPAILIDTETEIMVKCGEAKIVRGYYEKLKEPYTKMGMDDILLYLELNTLTVEEQAFLFNRLINITSHIFVRELVENLHKETAREWLANYMKRETEYTS